MGLLELTKLLKKYRKESFKEAEKIANDMKKYHNYGTINRTTFCSEIKALPPLSLPFSLSFPILLFNSQ